MGVFDSIGLEGIGNFLSGTGFIVGTVLLIFLGVVIFGVGGFFLYLKLANKKQFYITVNLFKTVNGKKFFIRSDNARELTIPGTNVRLLKWKNMGIYSAYPTRSMGNNVYAYNINKFGQLTNFDIAVGEDETEAKMDFDQRDQTYAYLNLQALISKNYREKNKANWWKENLPLITVIVSAILLILAMWFFFSQSAHQLATWTQISKNFADAATRSCAQTINSGLIK